MNLYDLDAQIQEIIENGFIINEDTGEVIFEANDLSDLQNYFDKKVDNIVSYIKNLEALTNAIDEEEKILRQRKKIAQNKADSLRKYVANFLISKDMKKFETARTRLSFRKSTSVNITDFNAIPSDFVTEEIVKKISKTDIKNALKKGETVAGAELLEKNNLVIK